MDPQACFDHFVRAAQVGDLDEAAEAAQVYSSWRARGGIMAKDDDDEVLRLDAEQDRYLVVSEGGREIWRSVWDQES